MKHYTAAEAVAKSWLTVCELEVFLSRGSRSALQLKQKQLVCNTTCRYNNDIGPPCLVTMTSLRSDAQACRLDHMVPNDLAPYD